MPKKKQKQPYNIPDNILSAIREHTKHGYILFTYDDQDNFRVYVDSDDDVVATAIKSNSLKWLQVMDNIESTMMAQSIFGADEEGDGKQNDGPPPDNG